MNKQLNLADPKDLTSIRAMIADDVDEFCMTLDEGPRKHLGASKIASDCPRALWFDFRWVNHTIKSGRMQRIFKRGHEEELKIKSYMEGAGFKFVVLPEFYNEEKGQHVFKHPCGHYGGSCDGIVTLPEKYNINSLFIWENKTSKDGSEFKELMNNGLRIVKPLHYSQTCVYGANFSVGHVIYSCVNKNTDFIYWEVDSLSKSKAEEMEKRALEIIFAKEIPNKISEKESFWKCKMCDHKDLCFNKLKGAIMCRTCRKASPKYGGGWFCEENNCDIPAENLSDAYICHVPFI